jgi:hypothetical protein
MIIIGIVREVNAYHSPKEGSLASKTFLQLPTPIPRDQFIPERSTPCEPVNVAGHTWCNLRSAEFLIWVKQDGEAQINLSNRDAQHMAHGVRFSCYQTIKVTDLNISDICTDIVPYDQYGCRYGHDPTRFEEDQRFFHRVHQTP